MKLLTPAIIQLCLCAWSIDLPLQFSPCLSSRASPASAKTHPLPAAGYTFNLVPSCSSLWSPTVSIPAVCLSKPTDPQLSHRGSFDSKSSGAFSSPRSSETWDQFPGGGIASSMLALPIKQSCHCRGWEAGEIKHYWCINEGYFFQWIIAATVKSGGYFGPLCISKPPFLKALGLNNIRL